MDPEVEHSKSDEIKAIVIFDTRYGNTERIARSFEAGLKQTGVQTVCINAKDVPVESLRQYDLICVGAPTEEFSASKAIKAFLASLNSVDLSKKYGYAFDTKASPGIFGSAAKFIEKELKNTIGIQIVAPRESAVVFTGGRTTSARLKEGEDKRFEQIGAQVGRSRISVRGRKIPA